MWVTHISLEQVLLIVFLTTNFILSNTVDSKTLRSLRNPCKAFSYTSRIPKMKRTSIRQPSGKRAMVAFL